MEWIGKSLSRNEVIMKVRLIKEKKLFGVRIKNIRLSKSLIDSI
jgi:hypothetical protein